MKQRSILWQAAGLAAVTFGGTGLRPWLPYSLAMVSALVIALCAGKLDIFRPIKYNWKWAWVFPIFRVLFSEGVF